jgi:transcription elongation factor Elf1
MGKKKKEKKEKLKKERKIKSFEQKYPHSYQVLCDFLSSMNNSKILWCSTCNIAVVFEWKICE